MKMLQFILLNYFILFFIQVDEVTPSSVNGVKLSSSLISSIGINRSTLINEVSTSLVNQISTSSVDQESTSLVNQVSTSSVDRVSTSLVDQVSTSSVDQVSTSSVDQVSTSLVDQVSTLSVHIVSTLIKPTSSLQPTDCTRENLQVPLSWPIGVGFLLFTNFITIFMFIISCLLLLRSKGKLEKL